MDKGTRGALDESSHVFPSTQHRGARMFFKTRLRDRSISHQSTLSLALVLGAALGLASCVTDSTPTGGSGGSGGSGGATPGGEAGSPGSPSVGATEVGPGGGTISDGAGAEVVIPPGALPEKVTLEAKVVPEPPPTAVPNGLETPATYLIVTPHGTTFEEDVVVTLDGVGPACRVFKLENETDPSWEEVDGVTCEDGVATFTVRSFSIYASIDPCTTEWFADNDGDGFGAGQATVACDAPSSASVKNSSDCDDAAAAVNPDATETCNEVDDDCDGTVDEADASDAATWYADSDADGYGDSATTKQACAAPAGYVANATDCNDEAVGTNPGATESCDGVDNNCDGTTDENAATDAITWYADADGDTYGDSASTTKACSQPTGYVSNATDCNDDADEINPAATEVCDEVDNDCDSVVDEAEASDALTWYADVDADGYGGLASVALACSQPTGYVGNAVDCHDGAPAINPGAAEVCDEVDNDCDGVVDEDDAMGAATWYADADRDAYGDPASATQACNEPSGYVSNAMDCDDSVAETFPGATEFCDDVDNDCNGLVDDDEAADAVTWYADADADGFGDSATTKPACSKPTGYVLNAADCSDGDASRNPDADELCDEVDNNCDGVIDEGTAVDAALWYPDLDADGFGGPISTKPACTQPPGHVANALDCNDVNETAYPGADEVCDEVDNDCDGVADEDSAIDAVTWYADLDADTFGDPASTKAACIVPNGYVANSTDCDDARATTFPGAVEVCDEIDNDCNGIVDEDSAADALVWYADSDGDDYGDPTSTKPACTQPTGYVSNALDCDDVVETTHPAADERCDEVDNDCDGVADEDSAVDAATWYADLDADGYGDPASTKPACSQPNDYVANNTDCDDARATTHPAAVEVCDELDNDCNGIVDEDSAVDALTWYEDADGDGHGDPSSTVPACTMPDGHVAGATDCNDLETSVNPDASETCNGVDDDCDGEVDDGADALCDNALFCDGTESCGGVAGCQAGTAPELSDGNDCTDDACDEAADAAVHTPTVAGAACGDPSDTACTAADTCDGTGSCLDNDQDGAPCDDENDCTEDDSCLAGSCSVSSAVTCGVNASCDPEGEPVCGCVADYADVDGDGDCDLSAEALGAGDLVITEIMRDPTAVDDVDGEWFEIYNASAEDVELDGLVVSDNDADSFVVTGSVIVAAADRAVFCRNGDSGTNGGVSCDYDYGTDPVFGLPLGSALQLANVSDELVLGNADGDIDSVVWADAGWPETPGTSMTLDPTNRNTTDNLDAANWCDGAPSTPGAENTLCHVAAQCALEYNEFTSADRLDTFNEGSGGTFVCDRGAWSGLSWYRFAGDAGTQMPEAAPPIYSCGTHAPGWLNGSHPEIAEGHVTREVCYHWSGDTCRWSNDITVLNCGNFFLYELPPPPACSLRYCGSL